MRKEKGFTVKITFVGGTEQVLEGVTEIHYKYPSIISEKRIAFEGLETGVTYKISHIEEFEAIYNDNK